MNDKAVYRIAPATPGLLNITNPADMLQWNFMVGLDFCVNNRFTLISRSVKARCCSSNTVINHSLGKLVMIFLNATWSVNPPVLSFWTFSHTCTFAQKTIRISSNFYANKGIVPTKPANTLLQSSVNLQLRAITFSIKWSWMQSILV